MIRRDITKTLITYAKQLQLSLPHGTATEQAMKTKLKLKNLTSSEDPVRVLSREGSPEEIEESVVEWICKTRDEF